MVGPNFRVGKKIGSGNFGELRLGETEWREGERERGREREREGGRKRERDLEPSTYKSEHNRPFSGCPEYSDEGDNGCDDPGHED